LILLALWIDSLVQGISGLQLNWKGIVSDHSKGPLRKGTRTLNLQDYMYRSIPAPPDG
jgi:hypothetical protein